MHCRYVLITYVLFYLHTIYLQGEYYNWEI
jgi:hypothetical protein